jgi:hypothetical protein
MRVYTGSATLIASDGQLMQRQQFSIEEGIEADP